MIYHFIIINCFATSCRTIGGRDPYVWSDHILKASLHEANMIERYENINHKTFTQKGGKRLMAFMSKNDMRDSRIGLLWFCQRNAHTMGAIELKILHLIRKSGRCFTNRV